MTTERQLDSIPRPGLYRHYKGGLYNVLGIARHHETDELFVVYQSSGEGREFQFNIRPLEGTQADPDGWLSPVTFDSGTRICTVDRFQYLGQRVPGVGLVP